MKIAEYANQHETFFSYCFYYLIKMRASASHFSSQVIILNLKCTNFYVERKFWVNFRVEGLGVWCELIVEYVQLVE